MRAGIVAVALCAVHAAGVAFAAPRPVRCILSGFEIGAVSPEELLANAEALDRLPFDGDAGTVPDRTPLFSAPLT